MQEVVLLRDITRGFTHIIFPLLYQSHKDTLPIANTVLGSVWDGWMCKRESEEEFGIVQADSFTPQVNLWTHTWNQII